MLRGHGRYDYSPIVGRPRYDWPGGKRLAVYLALNLEAYAFGEGLVEELAPGGPQPDIMNFAWRDYGNRVGAWRLMDLFRTLELPFAALLNSAIYEAAPPLAAAIRAVAGEIVCHGRTNSERQGDLSESAEAALIAEATSTIAAAEGTAPRGWLGPWISESAATPDLLDEAGYDYVLDWCADDQPIWLRTRRGRLLAVPYPQELNDSTAIVARRTDAETFARMIIANFDEMRDQAADAPLVMGIALHAYIAGQPYRLHALRRALRHIAEAREDVWIATPGEIARHVRALPEGIVPGD
jgi:allantoinase